MINIGLLGCGTVGSGVVELLWKNAEAIARRTGDNIIIKKVLEREPDKCRTLGLPENMLTGDIDAILDDPHIDIVVELIGGIEPAFTFIIRAMQAGKHVVSANKDLIAVKGRELFETAGENGIDFYFEASVGGGIPIV